MPKKKKTETTPVEKQVPREIKSAKITTRGDGVLLTLDGQDFLLSRNDMLNMISQHSPGLEPLRISDLIPGDDFADLNTVANVAMLTVLTSQQKLPSPEVAKWLGIPFERFIKWLNDDQSKIDRRKIMGEQKGEYLRAIEKFENKEFPKEPRKELRGFDAKKVGELFVEGEGSIDFVIKKLKTNKQEFMTWFQLNTKSVTKHLNATAQNRVINELRDLIDREEDDDRAPFVIHT